MAAASGWKVNIGEGTTFWFTIPMYHQVRKRETGTFR